MVFRVTYALRGLNSKYRKNLRLYYFSWANNFFYMIHILPEIYDLFLGIDTETLSKKKLNTTVLANTLREEVHRKDH